jgi:hypothetical protein
MCLIIFLLFMMDLKTKFFGGGYLGVRLYTYQPREAYARVRTKMSPPAVTKWFVFTSEKYQPYFHCTRHHILEHHPDMNVRPVMMDQHTLDVHFKRVASRHALYNRFLGLDVKIQLLVELISQHMGEYLMVSDVDLAIRRNLNPHLHHHISRKCDMVLLENIIPFHVLRNTVYIQTNKYNIGLMMIHCNERTLQLFSSISINTDQWDEKIINKAISTSRQTIQVEAFNPYSFIVTDSVDDARIPEVDLVKLVKVFHSYDKKAAIETIVNRWEATAD